MDPNRYSTTSIVTRLVTMSALNQNSFSHSGRRNGYCRAYSTAACSLHPAQVGRLHVHFFVIRPVQYDSVSAFGRVEETAPPSATVQSGRGGERVQLHTRSGRVQQPQVGGLHTQLARSVCEGDDAPAFGAVIPCTPPGESVQRGRRERVQLHGRTGREDLGDQLGCHPVPA